MIDIRTLHIGSHVNIGGKRCEVCSIDDEGVVRLEDSERNYTYHQLHDVEPIALKPALLEELGFEDCTKKRWHTEDWEKRWGECQYLSFTKLYRGEWRVHYFDGAKDSGQTVVRYLHEAEAFLALHSVELIEN